MLHDVALVALSLFKAATGSHGVTGPALALVPPVHMYLQLRGAYGLRWWSALLRTVLLLIFAVTAAIIFMLLLVALGVLG